MRITRTEVFVLGDPQPYDENAAIRELAFVRIYTDEGIVGLSEIFAVPAAVVKAVLDGPDSYFGKLLVGTDPLTPERNWRRLYNSLAYRNRRGWAIICLGAIDVALWDIYGQVLRRPVHELLGGVERSKNQVWNDVQRTSVVPYCTLSTTRRDRDTVLSVQLAMVERVRELGYRAIKVEPLESSPRTIIDLATAARRAIGPDVMLAVDVGYLWNDVGLAVRVADALAELDVLFLETPFPTDSLPAYATLSGKTTLRIAAGEHSVTRWEMLDLMDRGGCTVVQPYMTTVGGLTEAKRVVELAESRGVLVCPGNWSSQVLGAATVHLAAVSPITPAIEFAPAEVYGSPLRKALQDIGLPVVSGTIAIPTAPGIGVHLPDDLVAHYRIA